jgi:hypothetical protein
MEENVIQAVGKLMDLVEKNEAEVISSSKAATLTGGGGGSQLFLPQK